MVQSLALMLFLGNLGDRGLQEGRNYEARYVGVVVQHVLVKLYGEQFSIL